MNKQNNFIDFFPGPLTAIKNVLWFKANNIGYFDFCRQNNTKNNHELCTIKQLFAEAKWRVEPEVTSTLQKETR
jgi:hypothetical protein